MFQGKQTSETERGKLNTISGLEEYSQGCEFSLQEETTEKAETISHSESVTEKVKEEKYVENQNKSEVMENQLVAINENFAHEL